MGAESGFKHSELTYSIIGCCQKVHRTLGPGFPESVYHRALALEFADAGIAFDGEKAFDVRYEGACCGTFRADFVVDGTVVVELKALSSLNADHLAQVISYLKASGLHVGLLINFGRKSLETKRVAL